MSDSSSDRSQVLRAAAARKHHDAVQRAERAIRQLVKEGSSGHLQSRRRARPVLDGLPLRPR